MLYLIEEMTYLSRTQELELEGNRVQTLQTLVDRVTDGTGIQARVVIMNRGQRSNAFVMPDGSIFISQSLINTLDSMDEIGGVLGHEIGHLINKTYEKKRDTRSSTLGVGWIHEAAADTLTP